MRQSRDSNMADINHLQLQIEACCCCIQKNCLKFSCLILLFCHPSILFSASVVFSLLSLCSSKKCWLVSPCPSNKHHRSNDDCLEGMRENCAQCNAHIPHTNRPNSCLLVRFSFFVVILCCSLSVLDLALWDYVVSSIYLFFLA